MLKISDLKTEFAVNPVGIDTYRPRFSWVARGERGAAASACQIIVASTPEALAAGKGDLWDSGRIVVAASPLVEYDGAPLASRQHGWWKVLLWDETGTPSESEEPASFELALLEASDWRAEWIGSPGARSGKALYFTTMFELAKPVALARAYVAGLGWHEFHVNGDKVGRRVLEPAQSEFSRRVLYSIYDITSHLREGRNVAGAVLGNGWYGVPKLMVQIEITFVDGSRLDVITGGIGKAGNYWMATDGPIVENSVYDGEVYDARLEKPRWSEPMPAGASPGDTDAWWNSMMTEPPGGRLVPQTLEPIEVIDTLEAKSITEPKPGIFVFDTGQNLAGWARLAVSGPRGTTVTLRFAESIYPDGTVNQENLRAALARDIYTLKGTGLETWEPRFTYHGFRYVQVEGFPGRPTKDSIRIRVVRSAVRPAGQFESSHPLVNRINKAVFWTETSNLHGVPTDCPQRAERMGWLNDMAARSEELLHNFNVSRLLPKWLNDITDGQDKDGAIADTAPFHWGSRPADPVAACYLLIPWLLYQHYGDKRAMADQYDGMKGWVDYLTNRAPDSIVEYSYYGDWAPPIAEGVAGSIGSSAVALRTPGKLISTAHYYYAAVLFARMAALLGRSEDAATYTKLAGTIHDAFNRHFWNEAAGGYGSNNQASNAAALYMRLVPEERKTRVLANIVRDVEAHDDHLTTGNLCTKYILEVLIEMGRGDVAFRLVTQTSYPSWGYMFEHGATTIWERWEEATGRGMNSHNHPMYGSVGAWLYRALAGIRILPDGVGFSHVAIRPVVPEGLTSAEGSIETVRGVLSSRWEAKDDGFSLQVKIPLGVHAEIRIPKRGIAASRLAEGGQPFPAGSPLPTGLADLREEPDAFVVNASSGLYSFEVSAA